MKKVAIIGPNGQLGTDLVRVFLEKKWEVHYLTHRDVQVENLDSVHSALKDSRFDYIINTAAFHKVEECELKPSLAWNVNSNGAMNVASITSDKKFKTVYISTDYVFDGSSSNVYGSNSRIAPLNVYGKSKAAGEFATLMFQDNLVFRISSVFGSVGSGGKGGNFVETIIAKARSGETLSIVDDILMSPTYTLDAAKSIERALSAGNSGILHVANNGITSWFNFAKKIIELTNLEVEIRAISSDKNKKPLRPSFSAIGNYEADTPDWEDALMRYLKEKGHIR